MKLKSQVNASLCSLQYALNEQLTSTYKVFAALILTEPPSKLRNCCRCKTLFSFKLSIHDFHEQNHSCHLNFVYKFQT